MRVVLDTCILKLATFPTENNASALIFDEYRLFTTFDQASPLNDSHWMLNEFGRANGPDQ